MHRQTPYEHEDLVGFLMRVAKANYLLGPSEIINRICGSANQALHVHEVPALAYFTGNTVEEISQLSGIEQRDSGEDRRWTVGGEWITKAVFTEFRCAKICPECLSEAIFIRGVWGLTFYKVCALHGAMLLDTCDACRKKIPWNRKYPHMCPCGFDFRLATRIRAEGHVLTLSKLITFRVHHEPSLLKGLSLWAEQVERLVPLSLDGLCKTIWFLGHCIDEVGYVGSGHGRRKPKGQELTMMLDNAFSLLNEWPTKLEYSLRSKLDRGAALNHAVFEAYLTPAQHYFQENLAEPELRFLAAAYEQQVNRLWKQLGNSRSLSARDRQYTFEFY